VSEFIRPKDARELASVVSEAYAAKTPLEICGSGSKRGVGRPLQTASVLSTDRLKGITLYEPTELIISARAGTPLSDIETALAKQNQQLAFEPIDLGPMLGEEAENGTIGAVFAANLSGSRRVQAGAARDHFLGMQAINGRGETFKSGGRVMKNVTGYDLCRGVAGSWGTLAVLSEVTMKVLPRAEASRTLIYKGLTDDVAVDAMCTALCTPFDVSGAVHLQANFASEMLDSEVLRRPEPVTALRLENFKKFLGYRTGKLREALAAFGEPVELDDNASSQFWSSLRELKFLQGSDDPVWRISTAPKSGAKVVSALSKRLECRAAYDWSGGLIWLQTGPSPEAGATEVRRVVAEMGGHATLVRGDAAVRASIDVFQPLGPGVAAITRKLKESFDPAGILNPGRMYPGV
jgi:glycolate oxidase FAD binding subunit